MEISTAALLFAKTLGPWLFVILEVAGNVRGVGADLQVGMPKAKRWGKAGADRKTKNEV